MGKIVVINGTPSLVSRINAVIEYAEDDLRGRGFEVERINVAELPAEDLIHTKFESEAIVKANGLVAEADAVIVVSPVYKASYTGVLKTFLDLIPQKGLAGKIVLPLFMGGSLKTFAHHRLRTEAGIVRAGRTAYSGRRICRGLTGCEGRSGYS